MKVDMYIQNNFWKNNISYSIGDAVIYSGIIYVCKLNNVNRIPSSSEIYWTKMF